MRVTHFLLLACLLLCVNATPPVTLQFLQTEIDSLRLELAELKSVLFGSQYGTQTAQAGWSGVFSQNSGVQGIDPTQIAVGQVLVAGVQFIEDTSQILVGNPDPNTMLPSWSQAGLQPLLFELTNCSASDFTNGTIDFVPPPDTESSEAQALNDLRNQTLTALSTLIYGFPQNGVNFSTLFSQQPPIGQFASLVAINTQIEQMVQTEQQIEKGTLDLAWHVAFGTWPPPGANWHMYRQLLMTLPLTSLEQIGNFATNLTDILFGDAVLPPAAPLASIWFNETSNSVFQVVAAPGFNDSNDSLFALNSVVLSMQSSLAITISGMQLSLNTVIDGLQTEVDQRTSADGAFEFQIVSLGENLLNETNTRIQQTTDLSNRLDEEQAEIDRLAAIDQTEQADITGLQAALSTLTNRLGSEIGAREFHDILLNATIQDNAYDRSLDIFKLLFYSQELNPNLTLSDDLVFAQAAHQHFMPLVHFEHKVYWHLRNVWQQLGLLNSTLINTTRSEMELWSDFENAPPDIDVLPPPPSTKDSLARDLALSGVVLGGVAIIATVVLFLVLWCRPSSPLSQPLLGATTTAARAKTDTMLKLL